MHVIGLRHTQQPNDVADTPPGWCWLLQVCCCFAVDNSQLRERLSEVHLMPWRQPGLSLQQVVTADNHWLQCVTHIRMLCVSEHVSHLCRLLSLLQLDMSRQEIWNSPLRVTVSLSHLSFASNPVRLLLVACQAWLLSL